MHTGKILLTALIPTFIFLLGCQSGTDSTPKSSDDDTQDSSPSSDSESVTDSESDSPPDSASSDPGSDTGDIPPDLPVLCQLDRAQTAASEQDDWSGDTKGDGRSPRIASNAHTLMAWHYLSTAEDAAWEIQVAPFDPEPDGGLPGPTPGPPGPIVNPASSGPVSMYPALAPNNAVFGIAWQDGRFDPTCKQETFNECRREIAFVATDGQGQALGSSVPIQITMDADIAAGPSIVATKDGYVVVWAERAASSASVMAVSVENNGALGTPQLVSAGNDTDNKRAPQVAAIGNVIVVVWGTNNQSKILSRTINEKAEPQGEINVIQDTSNCLSPEIAAGTSSFLVSWSNNTASDYEIFTRKLDNNGVPAGGEHQATWTTSDIFSSALAWNGNTFALAWLTSKNNGTDECLVASCRSQILAALTDESGQITSQPVKLSDDPNPVGNFDFAWDGGGWTAVYELPRLARKQVFYGRMVCE